MSTDGLLIPAYSSLNMCVIVALRRGRTRTRTGGSLLLFCFEFYGAGRFVFLFMAVQHIFCPHFGHDSG
ncbi:hypothetical protein B0H16DRAFT_1602008 [Mycena metata]|uniref:Uncharacterized protein n=1 Tax=Mycena metata TaxID=1033252 RepID=A0AAD7ML61_9AGAR|nr:hypothetical protein B0H16DRAFT_1602008 [Mycena metata]